MSAKSDLQILLDNVRLLKDRKKNFLAYESSIMLDETLFNIQYVSHDLISIKKAGRGRHTEYTINFKHRTITNDKKGLGVAHWSLNNEIEADDYVSSEELPACVVRKVSEDNQTIIVEDLINSQPYTFKYAGFNTLFKVDKDATISALYKQYGIYHRATQGGNNAILAHYHKAQVKKLGNTIKNVRNHFNRCN